MNSKQNWKHAGFHLSDDLGSLQLILVSAPIQSIALHFPMAKSVLKQRMCEVDPLSCLLFQYSGVPWTLFLAPSALRSSTMRRSIANTLSEELATRVIVVEIEDTLSLEAFQLFEGGMSVESYAFCADYQEDVAKFLEELEVSSEKRARPWDLDLTDGSRRYQFRSRIRAISNDQVRRGRSFVKESMSFFNAVLPPIDRFPQGDAIMPAGLTSDDFVDIVHAQLGVAEQD